MNRTYIQIAKNHQYTKNINQILIKKKEESKLMGNGKHTKRKGKDNNAEVFSYADEESDTELKKFDRRKWIVLGIGGLTLISLIILGSIFYNQRAIFALIFSFYCTYLWVLPLLCTMLRTYKMNLHIKREQKIGRLFMFFGFYFLFLWITSLTSLLMYLGGVDITVISYVVFWGTVALFAPMLLFLLITRL